MKAELEFFDVSSLPWEPIPGDRNSADFSRLARIAAGAEFDVPFASTEGCLVFEVRYIDPHRR